MWSKIECAPSRDFFRLRRNVPQGNKNENLPNCYQPANHIGSVAGHDSGLLLFEKGVHVAFVVRWRIIRFKGLLPTADRQYLEIQIHDGGRQAIRIYDQSSERRERKR